MPGGPGIPVATLSAILGSVAAPRSARQQRRTKRMSSDGRSPGARLAAAEALFQDFVAVTPYPFRPFVRSFDSFDEYERWRRAQTNPWYR